MKHRGHFEDRQSYNLCNRQQEQFLKGRHLNNEIVEVQSDVVNGCSELKLGKS